MADLQGDAWHSEQRRKSQDLIRVANPTEQDYTLVWDEGGASAKFVVPNKNKDMGWGNGMRVMQRYLAKKYVKEMVDKMIFSQADEKLAELKGKLTKQGAVDINFHANQQLMSVPGMRSDDPQVRQPIEDTLWLGIEEEFGVDYDTTPIIEKSPNVAQDPFERLENKRYQKEELSTPPVITETQEPTKKGKPLKHDLSEVAS